MPRRHTAMNFISTRGKPPPTSIDTALVAGLAPDGGLYVPARITRIALGPPLPTPAAPAPAVLRPYLAASALRARLAGVLHLQLPFAAPTRPLPAAHHNRPEP